MHEATLTQDQLNLLSRFEGIGGCVDYVILECDPKNDDVIQNETHKRAAVAALAIIGQRWANHVKETSIQHGISNERLFCLRIDHNRAASMHGKRLLPQDFLGPLYDYEQMRLFDADFFSLGRGYAYAFSDPPHSLCDWANNIRVTRSEASELFEAINRVVLGGITSESIILEWPVDWSNYFDAGKEWWGAFLWTFANPGYNRLIVLAASSTD